MKHLKPFIYFALNEGRLSLNDDEKENLHKIVEVVYDLIQKGSLKPKTKVGSLFYEIPKLTKKTFAPTPKEYLEFGKSSKTVDKFIKDEIEEAKNGSTSVGMFSRKDIDLIYNQDLNYFATKDNKGYVQVFIDYVNALAEFRDIQSNSNTGKTTTVPDWTKGVINLSINYLNTLKDSSNCKEVLRLMLYHEFIHAKDPVRFYGGMKGYTTEGDSYFASIMEFATFTGSFLEMIVNRTKQYVESKEFREQKSKPTFIERALKNILNYFSKGEKITQQTQYIYSLDWNDLVKLFSGQKINPYINQMNIDIERIMKIKELNPKMWKNFLGDLYKTLDEAKEIVNDKIKNLNPHWKQENNPDLLMINLPTVKEMNPDTPEIKLVGK